jgi:hypothetical protein
MVVRVFAAVMESLGVSSFVAGGMQVGATTPMKFIVLPLKVKIRGLILIGCAWQLPY